MGPVLLRAANAQEQPSMIMLLGSSRPTRGVQVCSTSATHLAATERKPAWWFAGLVR